jgi:hypothetical protein
MIVDRMQVSILSKANPMITLCYVLREDLHFPLPQEGLVITIFVKLPRGNWLARLVHKVL